MARACSTWRAVRPQWSGRRAGVACARAVQVHRRGPSQRDRERCEVLCLCAMSVPLVSLWWTGRVAGRERVGGVGGAARVLENRKQLFRPTQRARSATVEKTGDCHLRVLHLLRLHALALLISSMLFSKSLPSTLHSCSFILATLSCMQQGGLCHNARRNQPG